VHTTNWLPAVDDDRCNGCGRCEAACPVDAVTVTPLVDASQPDRHAARVDPEACLGCGVCVRACARDGIRLEPRAARVLTPVNNAHRFVLMATQRGKLQDLVFDNRVLWSHRALAALLGAVLRLPGLQRTLARRQLGSRYLESMLARHPD
jgi:Fe-S-cluster-containing hydrogenase component 2